MTTGLWADYLQQVSPLIANDQHINNQAFEAILQELTQELEATANISFETDELLTMVAMVDARINRNVINRKIDNSILESILVNQTEIDTYLEQDAIVSEWCKNMPLLASLKTPSQFVTFPFGYFVPKGYDDPSLQMAFAIVFYIKTYIIDERLSNEKELNELQIRARITSLFSHIYDAVQTKDYPANQKSAKSTLAHLFALKRVVQVLLYDIFRLRTEPKSRQYQISVLLYSILNPTLKIVEEYVYNANQSRYGISYIIFLKVYGNIDPLIDNYFGTFPTAWMSQLKYSKTANPDWYYIALDIHMKLFPIWDNFVLDIIIKTYTNQYEHTINELDEQLYVLSERYQHFFAGKPSNKLLWLDEKTLIEKRNWKVLNKEFLENVKAKFGMANRELDFETERELVLELQDNFVSLLQSIINAKNEIIHSLKTAQLILNNPEFSEIMEYWKLIRNIIKTEHLGEIKDVKKTPFSFISMLEIFQSNCFIYNAVNDILSHRSIHDIKSYKIQNGIVMNYSKLVIAPTGRNIYNDRQKSMNIFDNKFKKDFVLKIFQVLSDIAITWYTTNPNQSTIFIPFGNNDESETKLEEEEEDTTDIFKRINYSVYYKEKKASDYIIYTKTEALIRKGEVTLEDMDILFTVGEATSIISLDTPPEVLDQTFFISKQRNEKENLVNQQSDAPASQTKSTNATKIFRLIG